MNPTLNNLLLNVTREMLQCLSAASMQGPHVAGIGEVLQLSRGHLFLRKLHIPTLLLVYVQAKRQQGLWGLATCCSRLGP